MSGEKMKSMMLFVDHMMEIYIKTNPKTRLVRPCWPEAEIRYQTTLGM